MTVRSEITAFFAQQAELPPDRVDPATTFEDLGLDSIHLMEFAVWTKQQWEVEVVEGELLHEHTVNDAIDYVTERRPHGVRT